MKVSKNGAGLATLIVVLFGLIGVDLDINTAMGLVEAIALIGSIALMVWNQVSRPDVNKRLPIFKN